GPVPKRQLAVDPVFNSPIVTQLINKVLLDGKKTVAEGIVYGALEGASEKNGQDPVVTLKKALDNIRPSLEVRSRRVGGATYQVPIELKPAPPTPPALRWPAIYSPAGREDAVIGRVLHEVVHASHRSGTEAVGGEDTHKMAE